jgi:hypothetical protein
VFLPLLLHLHLSANNTTPFFSLSKAFVNSEMPTTGESIRVNIRCDTTAYGVHMLQSAFHMLSVSSRWSGCKNVYGGKFRAMGDNVQVSPRDISERIQGFHGYPSSNTLDSNGRSIHGLCNQYRSWGNTGGDEASLRCQGVTLFLLVHDL